ncbi:unnamed protein product [Parnassius mnemosyne]|uniref:ferroxidase n=1 Tax=Parnassius mnemosyne TaxID=213953 RepID=A0AAV1LVY7_9NEOP
MVVTRVAKIRDGKVEILNEHIKIYKIANFQNTQKTFQVTSFFSTIGLYYKRHGWLAEVAEARACVSRKYSAHTSNISQPLEIINPVVFEQICNETLESLCEYFEEIVEKSSDLKGADITFSDGVLTVALGPTYGTYVINRQSPNKQIWLSSPVSGPKRYDLILKDGGYWVYKHDGVTLHKLLQEEISKIVGTVDFGNCSHGVI